MKDGKLEHVAVVGAGTMGLGIGLEFARFGADVKLHNTTKASGEKAMQRAREDLDIMVETKLMSAKEANATYKRMHPVTDIAEAVSGAEYVAESVAEVTELKQEVFAKMDEVCPPSVILATNTSGLSVTEIALKTKHPERIVAAHYFMPPHMVPLVEVAGGQKTERSYVERTAQILRGMHKKVVVINVEIPRFLGNRVQEAINTEVKALIDKGVATPQMMDDVIAYGFGRRLAYLGLFKRFDMIGLDVLYTIDKSWGREPWKPIVEHYQKGELGMKTGKGFYDWPGDSAKKVQKRLKTELIRLMQQEMADGSL